MKKLFCVKGRDGKRIWTPEEDDTAKPVNDLGYWEKKQDAKLQRDCWNSKENVEKCHVSRGPDHMGVHGHRIARMRLQPKR